MDYITYIVVALIPALAVIIVAYAFLKKNNEKEYNELRMALKRERQKFFLEPRADAYQRLVLLMERINPNSLIMRLKPTNKSAALFQSELLENIRKEFDHNVAQQVFISDTAWSIIKKSKEETIKIINVAAQHLDHNATALDLASRIFNIIGELGELPTEIAIKALKKEFHTLF